MSSHTLFRSIRSVHADLFFIRASARAVVENRSIRGVVELLLIGKDTQERSQIESELARVLHSHDLYVSVVVAESVQSHFKRESAAFNQIAVRVDEPSCIEADPDWDKSPVVLEGTTASDLLDCCIRIGENRRFGERRRSQRGSSIGRPNHVALANGVYASPNATTGE
jgi:hypothetical protein